MNHFLIISWQLFDHLWIFMTICDHLWQFMIIYYNNNLGLVMYDHLWLLLALYDHLWSFIWTEAPNTPLWCGRGSLPWRMWAQTISMAWCLISNQGNSANTDSSGKGSILPVKQTNMIIYDHSDNFLTIFGLPQQLIS